jgi:hypothetical protein
MTEGRAGTLMKAVRSIARRTVALSSGDVYRACGLFHGMEAGPPQPVPIAEDTSLRQRLFPYRGEAPRVRRPDALARRP